MIKLLAFALALILPSLGLAASCRDDVNADQMEFISQGDGTVVDIRTGLMWQVCAIGQTWYAGEDQVSHLDDTCVDVSSTRYSWGDSFSVVTQQNHISAYGYNDWRLPNRSELFSIVDTQCVRPSISIGFFPGFREDTYWSSSPFLKDGTYAWTIAFDLGRAVPAGKEFLAHLRLVRESQEID